MKMPEKNKNNEKNLVCYWKNCNFVRYQKRLRKDAGVVDRGGLENRCAF